MVAICFENQDGFDNCKLDQYIKYNQRVQKIYLLPCGTDVKYLFFKTFISGKKYCSYCIFSRSIIYRTVVVKGPLMGSKCDTV